VELRRDQLWEVAQAYDAVTHLTEESFCKDLAAGRFNNSTIFPADRVATSWNLDDISFSGGAADRTMADLLTAELQAAAAIAIWTKEATQRCGGISLFNTEDGKIVLLVLVAKYFW
jgi:hypothetical protein